MKNSNFIHREYERAKRLFTFVQGELREMYVEARLDFTTDILDYLKPEIEVLLRQKKIEKPD